MSTFGTFNVAMLAAHGLTDRTIRTCNPTIPRDPRVMVPVVVDALVVRQAGAQWADTLMKRTPSADGLVPAKDLLPKPFALRRANNDLGFEVPPFEQRWPRFDHGIYCSLSGSYTEFLQHRH